MRVVVFFVLTHKSTEKLSAQRSKRETMPFTKRGRKGCQLDVSSKRKKKRQRMKESTNAAVSSLDGAGGASSCAANSSGFANFETRKSKHQRERKSTDAAVVSLDGTCGDSSHVTNSRNSAKLSTTTASPRSSAAPSTSCDHATANSKDAAGGTTSCVTNSSGSVNFANTTASASGSVFSSPDSSRINSLKNIEPLNFLESPTSWCKCIPDTQMCPAFSFDDEIGTLGSHATICTLRFGPSASDASCVSDLSWETQSEFLSSLNEELTLEKMMQENKIYIEKLNLISTRMRMLADSFAKLPTSSIPTIITSLSWTWTLVPAFKDSPFSLLELGSGSGKAAFCFVILSQGNCSVTGVEIVKPDLMSSMRDGYVYDKLLPNGVRMNTKFQAHLKDVKDVKSGDNYDVIFAQVKGMPDDAYHNIANVWNNSNAKILLVSCHVSWINFETIVGKDGVKGTLVGQFQATCTGGSTGTTFRVYHKDGLEENKVRDKWISGCYESLMGLDETKAEEHLRNLIKETGLISRRC